MLTSKCAQCHTDDVLAPTCHEKNAETGANLGAEFVSKYTPHLDRLKTRYVWLCILCNDSLGNECVCRSRTPLFLIVHLNTGMILTSSSTLASATGHRSTSTAQTSKPQFTSTATLPGPGRTTHRGGTTTKDRREPRKILPFSSRNFSTRRLSGRSLLCRETPIQVCTTRAFVAHCLSSRAAPDATLDMCPLLR